MKNNIAIIGGGASGMIAAATAARAGADVVLYEKNNRLGKKLLSTGNGRCNITNTNISEKNYHGTSPEFVNYALSEFGSLKTLAFFEEIGLMCKELHGGRVFPYSNQASAVLDVLRWEIIHCGVKLVENTDISTVTKRGGEFLVNGEKYRKVIIAAGGASAPPTGSNGSGFVILKQMGHGITKIYPALTQLKTENKPAALQGIRTEAAVRVKTEKAEAYAKGEIQFAAYGLTGPAIMEVSAVALDGSDSKIYLDLMPEFPVNTIVEMLKKRRHSLAHLTMENFLVGWLHKKLGQALLKQLNIGISIEAGGLTDKQIKSLAYLIKNLEFSITGHTGWENAQVTAGGALTAEFDAKTMESKKVKGLFAAGEVLDIYGDCGGYNLQWAWSSGFLAGRGAAVI